MLYIDQPISTGFSYGNTTVVNTTKTAAPYVWILLQAFYENFFEYENRDFGLFTESYGGHYGPEFTRYILNQNAAISQGDLEGEEIRMVAVGMSNPWVDARIQERANIDYVYDTNGYRQIINSSLHDELIRAYETNCTPAFDKCAATGTSEDCYAAWDSYLQNIEYPILAAWNDVSADLYLGDIREPTTRPPTNHVAYLQRADIQKALGAKANYSDNAGIGDFVRAGDGRTIQSDISHVGTNMKIDPRSFLGELSEVVQAGVKVLIWTGDADYVCNWPGTLKVADAVEWSRQETFANQTLEPYTLNGVQKGTFKSLENFTFMRIFEAGHNVPFYRKS